MTPPVTSSRHQNHLPLASEQPSLHREEEEEEEEKGKDKESAGEDDDAIAVSYTHLTLPTKA